MILEEFPNYILNDDGTIYSNLSNKLLKPTTNSGGYYVYRLRNKNRKFVTKSAHRLFAKAFLSDFQKDLQVDHIDCNKKNNSISNLEMVTRSENMKRAVNNGLHRPQEYTLKGKDHPSNIPVKLINLKTKNELQFINIKEAMIYLGYKNGTSNGTWLRHKKTDRIVRNHLVEYL